MCSSRMLDNAAQTDAAADGVEGDALTDAPVNGADEQTSAAANDVQTIHLFGVSHHQLPIALRERFSSLGKDTVNLLQEICAEPFICSAAFISTCNRVEVLLTAAPEAERDDVKNHLSRFFGQAVEDLQDSPDTEGAAEAPLYHLEGAHAVKHLFRVSAGLDSLVVGEPQILGQVKAAYQQAQEVGTVNDVLHRLFQKAFSAAKAVRTETKIGEGGVSVCYAARELAASIFGELAQARVMLFGAGEVASLALKHFHAAGVTHFFISNRTVSRAVELAQTVDGVPLPLTHFREFLPQADILIGAVSLEPGAPPLLSADDIEHSLHQRRGNPQFLIDLGVPRNFAPSIGDLSDAFLYNVDDLNGVVQANVDMRRMELNQAEVIIDEHTSQFCSWIKVHPVEPAIKEITAHFDSIRAFECQRTLKRLQREGLSEDLLEPTARALEDFSAALMAKFLHRPLETIRKSGAEDKTLLQTIRDLLINPLRRNR